MNLLLTIIVCFNEKVPTFIAGFEKPVFGCLLITSPMVLHRGFFYNLSLQVQYFFRNYYTHFHRLFFIETRALFYIVLLRF